LAGLTTAGNLNTNVSLYPPGGGAAILGSSSDRQDAQLTASGTWTVVVEDYQDLSPGTYSLSLLDLQGTLTSGSDPDRGAIASNQILNGTTGAVGDFDAYTFHATIGDRVLLTSVETSAGASYAPTIYLYQPGGSYVTSGPRIDYQVGATGTWVAVVQDQN